ncbi:metal-dependent transcriptional regulator [Clavibacter nebraskensis]|uniref:Manganese transport regulator n=3 Tax=Clavibacter nebraskensis TaxID=31963 RepID=A0AAI9EL87_9MICO|nr:metal-dependent transcriptional regulator [Clavibacter nebraskensis]KXU19634.1 DtxR family transcriptional regulator [Clavibacter nebraskensis]OAH18501.1 DtxR family transcriptional regulator [Clavibacter nebraskensis]QGV67556.1 metal-dependent transcriptional regulator [Clavibacter nebraskensis]QGV70355.1 metal-dependent transcriptional regulator [Clavibacter nebraskensis]QGV73145.1 metal-dependent transcriptional regulator [Clavibacter nebraskensis]
MSVDELSSAAQDYLKLIWTATEWTDQPMTVSRLAERLGIRPATASDGIRRLTAQGLVEHRPYGSIELTDDGRRHAIQMVRRHRLLETFLVEVLGYGWDEVHDEAEVLEHAVSDDFVARIDAHLGHPSRDPHGDPIPSANGEPHLPDATQLADAVADRPMRVRRISDEDPRLLRELAEHGIGLDATLVRAAAAGDASGGGAAAVVVTVDGSARRPLTAAAASAVWVSDAG